MESAALAQHVGRRHQWGTALADAARASGRGFIVGCGGHVLFRFVLHHFVPVLLSSLRHLRRPRRSPPSPPSCTPATGTAHGEGSSPRTSGGAVCQREGAREDESVTREERKETEETEETDGPTPSPLPEDGAEESGRPAARHRLWWLWDSAQNLESLRLGSFLASMAGGFRVVEFTLQRLRGRDDGWNAFLAGSIAGLSIAVDTKARQKAVSLYIFFKACGLVWSSLVSRGLLPRGGGRWTLGQHAIWCLLCGVMMYTFFCEGELLDSFVYRFLYSCTSHHDQYAMSYVRKHALGMAGEDPEVKAQERLDYASGKLRSVPPPVVVKRREHFGTASLPRLPPPTNRTTATVATATEAATSSPRSSERAE